MGHIKEEFVEAIMLGIIGAVRQRHIESTFYPITIWDHAQLVAMFAEEFAVKIQANRFVSKAAGLLHDIGAAMFGKEGHHITGVKEAAIVLIECNCPAEFVGPILDCIYSHRGSQNIPLRTPEAKCVAAADAMEHFGRGLESLWVIQKRRSDFSPMVAYQTLLEKLERDWAKTSPEIKPLLAEPYEGAKRRLFALSQEDSSPTRARRSKGKHRAVG